MELLLLMVAFLLAGEVVGSEDEVTKAQDNLGFQADLAIQEIIEEIIAEDEDEHEQLVKDKKIKERHMKENIIEENIDENELNEVGDECKRFSPQEIFYTEVNPRLNNIFDELGHFLETVMNKVEDGLVGLIDNVKKSPMGDLDVEEFFKALQKFAFGSMKDAHEDIMKAWRNLFRACLTDYLVVDQVLVALEYVKAQQENSDNILRGIIQELSLNFKAIVLNSIHVVQLTLGLSKENMEAHEISNIIIQNLPKIMMGGQKVE